MIIYNIYHEHAEIFFFTIFAELLRAAKPLNVAFIGGQNILTNGFYVSLHDKMDETGWANDLNSAVMVYFLSCL